jgi:peroxiredoxin
MRLLSVGLACLLMASAVLAAEPKIPRPAGEFDITLDNGQHVLLSKYHGKVTLLAIILTGCPHCQHSSTIFQKLADDYGPKGFEVLAAAINEDAKAELPKFIYKQGVKFPVGMSTREQAYSYLQAEQGIGAPIVYMPQIVVIDRKGVIRAQHGGNDPFFEEQEKNLRFLIEGLLKEPATARTPAATKTTAATKGTK